MQDTQTSLTYAPDINRIEGIGISERKIKDRTQVTESPNYKIKTSSSVNIRDTSGTIKVGLNVTTDDIICKTIGLDLRIPVSGNWQIKFNNTSNYSQSYYWSVSLRSDDKEIAYFRQTLGDKTEKLINAYMGKYTRLSAWVTAEFSAQATVNFELELYNI